MRLSSVGKSLILCAALALHGSVGSVPAHAQEDARSLPHPWRISLGVSTIRRVSGSGSSLFGPATTESSAPFVSLGISRDLSRLRSGDSETRAFVVSAYFDAATHVGLFSPSYAGLGASLRTGGRRGYGGVGLGYYRLTGEGGLRSGIGGKLFAGIPFGGTPAGRGFFGEIDVTLPATSTNAIPAFHLGYRF